MPKRARIVISYTASAEKAAEIVRQIEAKGLQGLAVQADQGSVSEAEGLVATAVSKFGKLDILVNNAGVFVTGAVGGEVDAAAIEGQNRIPEQN